MHLRAGEMAESLKFWLYKHKYLNLTPSTHIKVRHGGSHL